VKLYLKLLHQVQKVKIKFGDDKKSFLRILFCQPESVGTEAIQRQTESAWTQSNDDSTIKLLKVQCHEIVCQLRLLSYSLDLNNAPRISIKHVKSLFKNIWQFKQGASRCKMAGAGFHCIANYRAPILRFATTRITAWQSALRCSADCQLPLWGLIRTCREFRPVAIRGQIQTPDFGNPQYGHFHCGNPRSTRRSLPTQG
jgi:hypothetical protein